jgi:hypothetical protein
MQVNSAGALVVCGGGGGMTDIPRILAEHLKCDSGNNVRFVFPTQTAAFFWAQKTLSVFNIKTIALERFLAWDKFKESCIRTEIAGLKPANAVHRGIFAVNLAEKNMTQQMFSAIIPSAYAEDGTIFARGIARILPRLMLWRENYRRAAEPAGLPDSEDEDFFTLEYEYRQFLSKHNLFESAWERPPFKETKNEYFIFYPELIEDFAEYETLLNSPNIHIIKVNKAENVNPLYPFDSSRDELRAAILEIRRLYEQEKIPYEDMAISAPELDIIEPYIKREAAVYNVPLHLRSGKPLSRYGAGSFFSLAKDCVDNNFSFQALKSLLLNNHLPWRNTEKNEALIRFGIDNNCVSGYREDGKLKDVWEEAFRGAKSELYPYYKDIKYKLYGIAGAKSFEEIRKCYFVFRGDWENTDGTSLFLKNACSDESYDILARCIEELSSLIQIQKTIPDVKISGVTAFYIELLNEKQYVPEREEGGVNVFQYRVAAAAPFSAHFVLNANQKNGNVVYRSLKFLRPDKRKKLNLAEDDYDASEAFFRAYNINSLPDSAAYVWYSASSLTFSGWTMPHSFFNDNCEKFISDDGVDAYIAEKNWWIDGSPFPERLFPAQKKGFEFWRSALTHNTFNLINSPFTPDGGAETAGIIKSLCSAIAEKKYEGGKQRVSASDLQSFYKCAVFWLFENIFEIEEESLEARLLDDKSKGLLFHTILNNLFDRIKNEDKIFISANIKKYKLWAQMYTEKAAAEYRAFRGPLCAPLINAMAKGIQRHIAELLKIECKKFDGYSVSELEAEKKIEFARFILMGRIDRISVSAEGVPCIIDYKTGKAPAKNECWLVDNKLVNFQAPVYIKLYEETHGIPVEQFAFISIVNHEIKMVVDGGKSTRGDYQLVMEALERCLEDYSGKMTALDFRKTDAAFSVCTDCIYKKICRVTFSLNDAAKEKKRGA